MEKSLLPFRVNCEGYFFTSYGTVLASIAEAGYVVFPGGGVNKGENIVDAIKRETHEETGAVVKNITKIGSIKMLWAEDWITSKTQRERFNDYQGEVIHFFEGMIDRLDPDVDRAEDSWDNVGFMAPREILAILEAEKPFSPSVKEYREFQLRYFLKLAGNT